MEGDGRPRGGTGTATGRVRSHSGWEGSRVPWWAVTPRPSCPMCPGEATPRCQWTGLGKGAGWWVTAAPFPVPELGLSWEDCGGWRGLKPCRQTLSAVFPPVPQMNRSPIPWPLMATMWTTRIPSTSEYDSGMGLGWGYGTQGRLPLRAAGSDWCSAAFGLPPRGPGI